MVADLKSMDYETRLAVLDPLPLEHRRLRGDLILTHTLFEQGMDNKVSTVDPANTRQGHGERHPLNDKNKTDPANLGLRYRCIHRCTYDDARVPWIPGLKSIPLGLRLTRTHSFLALTPLRATMHMVVEYRY
ncbi:hypothetical protein CLF_105985 [Clonorchis sinensis]|uniref:Uncharacterized protein n=1 Tax=Clonorchis sinensis TaxID=79923 RepID=G7YEH6_CLOSI|nr:hypothetical protein CLF_105985 [Clonorchis sinensis]